MGLEVIRHQLQFLREDTRGRARLGAIGIDHGERWSTLVTNACMQALVVARKAIPFADGLWDRLELDLVYILTRHIFWIKTASFSDVLTDRIARGYRLERSISERIAAEVTRLAPVPSAALPTLVEANDTEFLRFVLVASCLARDDDALTQDLGLGRGFLASIKDSLSGSLEPQSEGASSRYLPEIEVRLSEIMLGLAESLKHNQWAMESTRLFYQLIGVSEPWLSWFRQNGSEGLFEFLVNIGSGCLSDGDFQDLSKIGLELPGPIEEFMEHLVDRGLLDSTNYSLQRSSRSRKREWHLSPFAYNLTAEAFAARFAADFKLSNLRKLEEAYQAAVVRRAVSCQSDLLSELLPCAPQMLGPTATRALLDGMASVENSSRWSDLALSFVKKSTSPWVRLAAVRALVRRGELAMLEDIWVGDGSSVVREAALGGLAAAHGAAAIKDSVA